MSSKQTMASIFDILGPVMIGPSSSHTAGASRIGRMGRQILGEQPASAHIYFYGSLAETYKGHMTDKGVIAGLLGLEVDDARIRKALTLAQEENIRISIHTQTVSEKNPNTIEMSLASPSGAVHVVGISMGGGEILITGIDGHEVGLSGKENTVLLFGEKQSLSEKDIQNLLPGNLLCIRIYRANSGDLAVLQVEKPLGKGVLAELAGLNGVRSVREMSSLYEYRILDAPPLFQSVEEMLSLTRASNKSLPEIAIEYESQRSGLTTETIKKRLAWIWDVMKEAMVQGLRGENRLVGGLASGKDGMKMLQAFQEGRLVSGKILPLAIARAIASTEVNASMGRVVAAPTAGSCGVLPGVLSTLAEELKSTDSEIIDSLLVASLFGVLIAAVAPVSGSLGGCQSEVGVSSAMAAAGAVQLAGGTPEQTAQAMALALKGLLGLACDPVAGLVEVPCMKRNAMGAASALAAADMALAGIESVVPPDEVIWALRNIQELMPAELKDTTLGGLGATDTAKRLKDQWLKKCRDSVERC